MAGTDKLTEAIRESARVVASLEGQGEGLSGVCRAVAGVLKAGGKVLTAGNGGSAAEAQHLSEELVGRFRADRPPLAAVALPADGTVLTCIGNDYGYEEVFGRQVRALGRPGDVLVLFSTSGGSRNLEVALEAGKEKGLKTVCLLGRDGGALRGRADLEVVVGSDDTARIQEAHQVIVHLILQAVEEAVAEP